VIGAVSGLPEFLFDAFLYVFVEVSEAFVAALGEVDVRHSDVVEFDDVAVLDLSTGDSVVFERALREGRFADMVTERVADQLALVEVVGMFVEERLEIVLHLVWYFDV
jgi:hypothetical protein